MKLPASVAVIALLLAGACGGSDEPTAKPTRSPSASESAVSEPLVVAPGRIGPALAGMTVDEASTTGLFEPFIERADDPCKDENPPIQWKSPNTERLTVRVKDDKIEALGVRDGVKTAKGIGVGSTYGDLKTAYPGAKAEPSQALGSTVYRQDGNKWLGLAFNEEVGEIKDSSKVTYLQVSVDSKPATYLSGCG